MQKLIFCHFWNSKKCVFVLLKVHFFSNFRALWITSLCFSRYHRCQFELPLNFSGHLDHQLTTGSLTPVNITSFSRWDQISEKLKPSDKPVVLNRASSTNTTNPFGSTFCYGYEDIIFEVMPNFHIASVTLYCQNAGRLNLNQMSHFNSQRFQINEEELLDDRLSSV